MEEIYRKSIGQPLKALAERFWSFKCYEDPIGAIRAGEKTADSILFREGQRDVERRVSSAKSFLRQLAEIPEEGLDPQDLATHRLLRRELSDIQSLARVRSHQRLSLFPYGPELITAYFSNGVALSRIEECEQYVDRLKTIPLYIADVIENLSSGYEAGIRYSKNVLKCAIDSVGGHLRGDVNKLAWFSPFLRARVADKRFAPVERHAQKIIQDHLLPAFHSYQTFLKEKLSVGARESVSCTGTLQGGEFYQALISYYTTAEFDALELHEIGRTEVERIGVEMKSVAAAAGFPGDLIGYREFLRSDSQFVAPSKELLREQFEVISKRIDLRIPAFFGRIPRATYGIQSIPEETSPYLPPAYAQPNPADGSGPGINWVTSLPIRAPSFMHVPLALHEGWPGHLMHLALVQELDELPAFRRFGVLRYSACIEGWALYCEALGVEMGMYESAHHHYGRLEAEMLRALRLVVDTGLHERNWTREHAVHYMRNNLALSGIAIEAEVDRYIGMPAQALAYYVGYKQFRDLRGLAEQRLGAKFNIRAFHDAVMSAGPVTLSVLEQLVCNFILRAANSS